MMHGLVSVDVTSALERLRSIDPPLSLTALVIAAVARTVAAHPEVHGYRTWSGRVVLPHFVDVATIVESATPKGPFPLAHLVMDADVRTVRQISDELRSVAADQSAGRSGRMLPWADRIPVPTALIRVVYRAAGRSSRLRRITGTVTVSAVGMFGGGSGHGIGVPTTATLTVMVGGLSRRPVVTDGDLIEPRDVLDLTISANHVMVDGAPVARFTSALRKTLESAGDWLATDDRTPAKRPPGKRPT